MGTATHAENWDQYMQDATFTQTTGGLMVSAPPTSNTAPPGYYMLFIMRGDVPSVAKIVQVAFVPPALSVSDVSVTEGTNGTTTNAIFNVSIPLASRSHGYGDLFDRRRTAIAGNNYVAHQRHADVCSWSYQSDRYGAGHWRWNHRPNETFTLNLSAPVGATLAKAQGTA